MADFFFRGSNYSVQFKPRVGDAFVMVTTDRSRVGQHYDSIAIGTSTTTTTSGGFTASWTSGTDQKVSRTFSYEGAIEVDVYDPAQADKHS